MEDRVSNIYNWSKIYSKAVNKESRTIIAWCHENLGKQWQVVPYENRDGVWCCFWRGCEEGYEFSFKYEEDAIHFALRWL